MGANKRDGVTRLQRAAQVRKLRDEGYTNREIGGKLGVSRGYVHDLLWDPDGSKNRLRKERYRGTCSDCGGKTTYPTRGKFSLRCAKCAAAHIHNTRKWTPERIIESIQEWNRLYGKPPYAEDWFSAGGDGTMNSRRWPPGNVVQREFGTWSNALEAAGFERRVPFMCTEEWKAWVAANGRGRRVRGPFRYEHALSQWASQLRQPSNGDPELLDVPSFESRGEGRSLADVVADLK